MQNEFLMIYTLPKILDKMIEVKQERTYIKK